MLFVNYLKTEIEASSSLTGKIKRFGFEIPFKGGLNIITGNNTSGKSTIISCLYYCLGLEQLLGGKNEKVLDNALRRQFRIDDESFHVNFSAAEIEVVNTNGVLAKLKRKITGFSSESESQKIYIISENRNLIKFIHSPGDTIRENGFFNWLEDFLGINLPSVATFDDKERKLYFQNIFSAIFIEQKKGWSDYFSTSPTFSIKNINQKIFEYLLGLKSLENDFEIDKIKGRQKELKIKWNIEYEKLKSKLEKYDAVVKGIYADKIVSKTELENDLKVYYLDSEGKEIEKDGYVKLINIGLANSNKNSYDTPESKVQYKNDNRNKIKNEIVEINNSLNKVQNNVIEESEKIALFENKAKSIKLNIQNLQDLNKIKTDSGFLTENISYCPLCHEKIKSSENNIRDDIENITIDQNISYLQSQLSLYESYLKSSTAVLNKLKGYSEYYQKLLNDSQLKYQIAQEEIATDLRLPSKQVLVDSILLEQKLNEVIYVEKIIENYSNDVSDYFKQNKDLTIQLEGIEKGIDEDLKKLTNFQKEFVFLLKEFGYTSQKITSISIDNAEPHRLLPAIKIEGQKESLRITSSASDFVRALWAYYFALMKTGENHPHILIFDEPGQHAMMLNSLQKLVEECAKQKNSQIILAMSKDKPGEENINLTDILKNVKSEDVNIFAINENGKCICELPLENKNT